jgi:hypothetical protein
MDSTVLVHATDKLWRQRQRETEYRQSLDQQAEKIPSLLVFTVALEVAA